MILTRFFIFNLIVLFSLQANFQPLASQHFPFLKIKKNSAVTILDQQLIIDTLEMEDNSELLIKTNTNIVIKHAFVGKSARIIAEGSDGKRGLYGKRLNPNGSSGSEGSSGFDIILTICFDKLESIYISTNGGNGGQGGGGWPSEAYFFEEGFKLGQGGSGGKGGDAGNLKFNYITNGFIPIFNSKNRKHSINITTFGGIGGAGGSGGENKSHQRDLPGISGLDGKSGEIKINKINTRKGF